MKIYLPIKQSIMTANSIGDDLVTGKHMFLWFAAILFYFILWVSVFILI